MASFWKSANDNSSTPCPNCGAPLLSGMKECPRCHFSLTSKSVSPEAQKKLNDQQYIQNADKEFMICTTQHPTGYVISEERDIVTADCLFSNASAEGIASARQNALNTLKIEAIKKQCNAVLALHIDTCMLGINYCVTVYGTAARVIKQ